MAIFNKKPDQIEAFCYVPDAEHPEWLKNAINEGVIYYQGGPTPYLTVEVGSLKTRAEMGDYIVQDFQRRFYVIKRDVFERLYEPAN